MIAPDETPPADRGMVSIQSPYSFADTLQRLLLALEQHHIKVFAVVDQQVEAAAVGLTMPPATLIIFGNPAAGAPLMLARPKSGLDLPLKAFIVEAPSGEVTVSFNTAAYIIERYSLPPELLANLAPAERLLTSTLSG